MADTTLSGYPRGWFVVCFSSDLPALGVRPLRYFGRDLVAYRGEDGAVRVLDAHCPHMGAHFGYGGQVAGECIRCPFHAWRFGGDGACASRSPTRRRSRPRAQVRSWPVREINGHVLVYNDRSTDAAAPPAFEIPVIPEYGSDEWLPWVTHVYHVKTHPKRDCRQPRRPRALPLGAQDGDRRLQLRRRRAPRLAEGEGASVLPGRRRPVLVVDHVPRPRLPPDAHGRRSSRTTCSSPTRPSTRRPSISGSP